MFDPKNCTGKSYYKNFRHGKALKTIENIPPPTAHLLPPEEEDVVVGKRPFHGVNSLEPMSKKANNGKKNTIKLKF